MVNKNAIAYGTLFGIGLILIIIALPFYKNNAVLYTLLTLGVACLLSAVVLWAYQYPQKEVLVESVPASQPVILAQTAPVRKVSAPLPAFALKPAISAPKPAVPAKKETVKIDDDVQVKTFKSEDAPVAVASSPVKHFTPAASRLYKSVEDIRMERERLTNAPETPDIDRKRRTALLKEFALQLPLPRDGSMIPISAA